MSNYLLKGHHAIMKATALADYNAVRSQAQSEGIEVKIPQGKHWHKIEDATALMIVKLLVVPKTNRGFSYYKSIL